jgi:hypothetical protein
MIAGQIARNNLLLVEMAHLDRDITEDLPHSRPAIQDDCLEGIPHVFQGNPPLSIYINGLMGYLVNIQVLFEMG